jgi:hypothetical protein
MPFRSKRCKAIYFISSRSGGSRTAPVTSSPMACGSSCTLIKAGLLRVRFFYRITLGQNDTEFCLPRPKVPQRLPEILSREEIERLFAVTTNLKCS